MLGIAAASLAGTALVQQPGESVFGSAWFRALLGLLSVNIVVCTAYRLAGIWQAVFHPTVRPAEGLFERGQPRETAVSAWPSTWACWSTPTSCSAWRRWSAAGRRCRDRDTGRACTWPSFRTPLIELAAHAAG
jgi:hypothetical protein